MRKIALEEHFLCPDVADYWGDTVRDVPAPVRDALAARLNDLGDGRLEAMDAAGVDVAILSVSGPGVQVEPDVALATRNARASNEHLARAIADGRGRYRGFAHLALQDPREAVKEFERCVGELGFRGAMVHGPCLGVYLDDPAMAAIWECAQALDAPIYLHPGDPAQPMPTLKGFEVLQRATWGWGVETGSHALRILFAGVFDRFPKARLILGHLGETLPYLLWRFDSRAKLYASKLPKPPSAYIRDNMLVTCSGMYAIEPLRCAIDALGSASIMFSADYPFESLPEAAAFIDSTPIDEPTRRAICHENAERVFRLAEV